MAKISKFYLEKTETERRLRALGLIVVCEKLLGSKSISLVGSKACISSEKLGSVMSELRLLPDACNEFHQDVLKAIKKYMAELQIISMVRDPIRSKYGRI